MSDLQPPRPPTRRSAFGDSTVRANVQQNKSFSSNELLRRRHESPRHNGHLQLPGVAPCSSASHRDSCPAEEISNWALSNPSPVNPHVPAVSSDQAGQDPNRNSQISTVSTNASNTKRIKSCIGPWKLGKTLGKGATARVRLARHVYTGQNAAVKIVQKRHAQLSQAGSLAALDQAESTQPRSEVRVRRMPIGIEREVAIMKLIQHPNIMKLYDIWENRTEM
jgi:serine/threonine-protein kinase HSL1 (negative regulator of Swe1 kinase)